MQLEEYKASLRADKPPSNAGGCLEALWHDGRNDWEAAHRIAQDIEDRNGFLIHAYLHRKEGDAWNAEYWYRKAGNSTPDCSLDKEWEELVIKMLELHSR